MGRTYKWLGGIGYILSLIPYVNFIAMIIIGIAWILIGKDTDQKLFKATGALIISLFALLIAIVAAALTTVPSIFTELLTEGPPLTGPPSKFLSRFFGLIVILIGLVIVMAVIGLAALVAEIASHFRASSIFQSALFKVSGWLRIITIIALIIAVPVVVFTVTSMPEIPYKMTPSMGFGEAFSMLMNFFWPLIIVWILSLLATVFSAVAFFTIPEEAPKPPPPPPI